MVYISEAVSIFKGCTRIGSSIIAIVVVDVVVIAVLVVFVAVASSIDRLYYHRYRY